MRRFIAVLPLMMLAVMGAWAQQEAVSYRYHTWENDPMQGKYRVHNYGKNCESYKVLDSSTSLSDSGDFGVGDNKEWDKGGYKWVVVKGEVTINTLLVIGEAHLILTDGSKLTCTGGVQLEAGNSLTIYGQSVDGFGEN